MTHFYRIIVDCPCNLNCPNGCNDCPNPICVCGENQSPQNKDNLEQCMKEKSIDLGQCIIDCKGDESCEQSCVNLFKDRYNQCPCQVKNMSSDYSRFHIDKVILYYFQEDCPFGCPCDSFDCRPDKKSVLVLNTDSSSNIPILIKFDGKLKFKI